MTVAAAALRYAEDVLLAERTGTDGEPEAQLTAPTAALFEAVAADAGLRLRLVREVRLNGVRPDFQAVIEGRQKGWVELKAPTKSIDGRTWRGREAKQWALLAERDALIVSNGLQAQFYVLGEPAGDPVDLPTEADAATWNPAATLEMIHRLREATPEPVVRVRDLAKRLAPLTRMLRDRLLDALTASPPSAAVVQAQRVWGEYVHELRDAAGVCDDIAQVVGYSLAIAALRGGADRDGDGVITLREAKGALQVPAPVLSATLGAVLDDPAVIEEVASEVAAVERLISAVDSDRIRRSRDSRGEPWLYFYEDFLTAYDPNARQAAGVYYTPREIVRCQVRLVDEVLRDRFGKALSYAAPGVTTLDPACGSGTYPLAVIDAASKVAFEERGVAGPAQIAPVLARNLLAFELLPGPYALAHLRVGERLVELAQVLPGVPAPELIPHVMLADTLESPDLDESASTLFGDSRVLAEERRAAREVKRDRRITAILGNPPYRRLTSSDRSGGWVTSTPGRDRSLFADILDPARENTIFSHQASLYNLYVYFWRWSLWKAFEAHASGPGVVSLIAAASWLDGPGFLGLRQLARELGDEIWVIDLGGDNRGSQPEDNVFAIETPVAIVTVVAGARPDRTVPARVRYRRIRGSRAEKLAAVEALQSPDTDADSWTDGPEGWFAPFTPTAGDAAWAAHPALTDLFPWQQPGCKVNRTWPIAPDQDTLLKRWEQFVSSGDLAARAAMYVTPNSGRTIYTRVGDFPPLAELPAGSPPPTVVRYAIRSFDLQWTFEDPRLMALERPSLWGARSDRQIYLTTLTSARLANSGPAATATTAVPDMHYFDGRGGKDIIPLYRDADGTPNIAPGVVEALTLAHRDVEGDAPAVTPERLLAYAYGVLAGSDYTTRFNDALSTPGPRVPVTADPVLFTAMADHGDELLWLQTFGERRAAGMPARLPRPAGLGWTVPVGSLPTTPEQVEYDAEAQEIRVGAGRLTGVRADVWNFRIGNLLPLQRWLDQRTRRGSGRAATRPSSDLDRIRPTAWADAWNDELLDLVRCLTATLDLLPRGSQLLAQVLEGTTIAAADLPPVPDSARRPPTVPSTSSSTAR